MQTKKEYFAILKQRYKSTKKRHTKSRIIDEAIRNTGLSRKHVIKKLNKKYRYRKKRKPKKLTYTYDLTKPLKKLWYVAGNPCSKRLKPQIPTLLSQLKKYSEIQVSKKQEALLIKMGSSTIDRLLYYERQKNRVKGISGTKRSPLLKHLIPVRTNFDDVDEAGHLELDCVLHCGTSLAGVFAETLNTLDIHTHWNEKDIFLKKTKKKVIGALHESRSRFPFRIKSIDFDGGAEFVNWGMYNYCKREKMKFSRCRANQKNDQAHIEGKNFQAVRKLIGYERIMDEKIVKLIRGIYLNEDRLLTNFFYTTLKLKSKKRVGSRVVKKYELARSPYQRIMRSKKVSLAKKYELKKVYDSLNPAELQRSLQKKLKKLNKLISVSKLNHATPPA